jgi:prophage tail gpP-like protein
VSGAGAVFTDRVTIKIGAVVLSAFTGVTIGHDLDSIASTFAVKCLDTARLRNALKVHLATWQAAIGPLGPGLKCTVSIDKTVVLVGWIDRIRGRWTGIDLTCEIVGRDVTGDLVDCMPLPEGPAEFHNVDLLAIAKAVCKPFGIVARADTDIGAPFERLSFYIHETAMSALEKAARQRAVLVTSDGVGGLLLTKAGTTRGPAPLTIGGNVQEMDFDLTWERRFSDYYIKGQSANGRLGLAAMDATVAAGAGDHAPTSGATGRGHVLMSGHAIDPEIARYRPTVRTVRTQSGMDSVQEQAEWLLRVAKGQSDRRNYHVLDWRDGPKQDLWLPNQLVAVYDPFIGIDGDMLIAGVRWLFDERGARTEMRLVGKTAYDRIHEAARRRGHHHNDGGARGALDKTVTPVTAKEGPK